MNDIEIYNRRLKRLAIEMGLNPDGEEEVDVDTSGMNSYEKGRFECTLLVSNIREDAKVLDKLDSSEVTKRAAIGNRVRKNMNELKSMSARLRKEADKHHRQEDYRELASYVKRTENMWKQRFRSANANEDDALGATGGTTYGTTNNMRTFEDLSGAANDYSNYGADEDLLDPMQDDGFQQYYQDVKQRDEQIEEGLKSVYSCLLRVKQNALVFSQELETQNVQIDKINVKAEMRVAELKSLNKKLAQTLVEVDKGKYCCYIICLLLVLGVLGVVLTETGVLRK